MLNYIRTTTTRTGLQVRSIRVANEYQAGVKISRQQLAGTNLTRNTTLPHRNYDIQPHEIPIPIESGSVHSRSTLLHPGRTVHWESGDQPAAVCSLPNGGGEVIPQRTLTPHGGT